MAISHTTMDRIAREHMLAPLVRVRSRSGDRSVSGPLISVIDMVEDARMVHATGWVEMVGHVLSRETTCLIDIATSRASHTAGDAELRACMIERCHAFMVTALAISVSVKMQR